MVRAAGKSRTERKMVGYSPAELAKLQKKFDESACGTMSEYIRILSLGLPVKYRDISLDSLIDELIILRSALGDIRSDLTISPIQLTQIVEKLTEIYLIIDKIANHVCTHPRHRQHIKSASLSRE